MTTTEDLRRILADNASRAPQGIGLAEAAVAGAARVRRRRRYAAAGVAALVACAFAAAFALIRPGPDTPPAIPVPARFHLTVELVPGGTYMITHAESDGRTQFYRVRLAAYIKDSALIRVTEPGTYDGRDLLAGERIVVGGHPAYHLSRDGIVGWPDPSGAWVLVSGAPTRAELVGLAGRVRTTPPRPMRAAVRFTELPQTLRYATASVYQSSVPPQTGIGFDRADKETPRSREILLGEVLTVQMYPRWAHSDFGYQLSGAQSVTIAGYRAEYLQAGGSAMLIFQTETCTVSYRADDAALLPFDVLARMAGTARYADCTQPVTWFNLP